MRKHILVVDRSQTIRVTCKIHLENDGHIVLAASTSRDALQALPTCHPSPDVLLLGLREDSVDAENKALISYLQRRAPSCRCVLLVRSDVALPEWAKTFEVLPTPFTVQTLLDIVNSESMIQGTRSLHG